MRIYDLHVHFNQQENGVSFATLLRLAKELGYSGLAIESTKPLPSEFAQGSIEVLHRLTLTPRSATRLRSLVNRYRKYTDLLVIQGRTKPIWMAAAEISSLDMVMLKDIDDFSVIDSQIARTMTAKDLFVEVCLHELLSLSGPPRSRLMRVMHTALTHLVRASCSIILTSGARHHWELRAPKDLEALSFLASLPEASAKEAIRSRPTNLLDKLLHKTHSSPAHSAWRDL